MLGKSKNYNIVPWVLNICQYSAYEKYNIKGSICGRISTYTVWDDKILVLSRLYKYKCIIISRATMKIHTTKTCTDGQLKTQCAKSLQLCLTLWTQWTLWSASLLCPWDSPGKNTRVGCRALLQGIFLTQGSTMCLLCLPTLAGGSFTTKATWEALKTQ